MTYVKFLESLSLGNSKIFNYDKYENSNENDIQAGIVRVSLTLY